MGAREQASLLRQQLRSRFQDFFRLGLLCFCGFVLGLNADRTGPDVPLSHVVDLGSCMTPTTEVYHGKFTDLACRHRFTVKELTGGQWSSLVKGGSVEVTCRRSTHSLVFVLRNYPSFKASPLKALAAAFKILAGTDMMMMMGVEPLPKNCECGEDGSRSTAYAEDFDSEERLVEVFVKSLGRKLHTVLYDQTTCALPPLDVIHPGPHPPKAPEFKKFERLRKCFWRLVLPGNVTPFIQATRRLVFVDFEKGEFNPDVMHADMVLDLPPGCLMDSIDQEIMVWVRQTEVPLEAADGEVGLIRSEEDQKQLVTEVYVNVEPKEVGWTHWPYKKFESIMSYLMYYQW